MVASEIFGRCGNLGRPGRLWKVGEDWGDGGGLGSVVAPRVFLNFGQIGRVWVGAMACAKFLVY